MVTLSVLVAGIRPHNWLALYEAMKLSTSVDFEMIFVGPWQPPPELRSLDNIVFIRDYGPPMRAQQIAFLRSKGKFIIYIADDAIPLPGAIDSTLNMMGDDHKKIVVWKYTESDNPNPSMYTPEYYYIRSTNWNLQYVPDTWYSMLAATIRREYVMELGGWDCRFFSPPCCHIDFGIRAQRDGANCVLTDNIIAKVAHMPGETGDHAPIHRISPTDEAMFKSIYNEQSCVNRISISLDNWKDSTSVWNMRFPDVDKYSYDISICVPTIRKELLVEFYNSLLSAIGEYSFELIFVSPYDKPEYFNSFNNVKWIKSFASPTKCVQIGAAYASGRLFTWAADDGLFVQNSISKAIAYFDMNANDKDIMSIRYMEETRNSTKEFPTDYWRPIYHSGALQANGVYNYEYMALIGLMPLSYFKKLGGLDCIYEHVNMCCIDLSCRVYNNGGKVILSPTTVLKCDWEPGETSTHGPIFQAYEQNDIKRFREMYASQPIDRVCIKFDNYKNYPDIWPRRFNQDGSWK